MLNKLLASFVAVAAFNMPASAQFDSLASRSGGAVEIAQAISGRRGQIAAPYTSPLLNVKRDLFRVQVGNCPISMEFDSQPAAQTNTSTSAIVGCTVVPSGVSKSQATWPDNGLAGIAATYNSGKSAVGVFGYAGVGVAGTLAEAFNGVTANAPPGQKSTDGNGFDFLALNGVESDVNLYHKPNGDAPAGNLQGITSYVGGVTNVAPRYQMDAFAAISAGTINSATGIPTPRWINAYASHNGMAQVALDAGAVSNAKISASQSIALHAAVDGRAVTDTIFAAVDGSIVLTFGAGANPTLNLGGTSFLRASPGVNQIVDTAGAAAISVSPSQVTLTKLMALPALPVAALPNCDKATRDAVLVVSDATAPTYRGTLKGGGTVRTLAECDGTAWLAH